MLPATALSPELLQRHFVPCTSDHTCTYWTAVFWLQTPAMFDRGRQESLLAVLSMVHFYFA